MDAQVRVWVSPDLATQHFASSPDDETAHDWEGTTACGLTGRLRWVPRETVDRGAACRGCIAVVGTTPPLEGDDLGPV